MRFGKKSLLVGVGRAGDVVKGPGDADAKKVVHIVVVGIAILIVLHKGVGPGGNIVEIVKERGSHPELAGYIPFRVQNIF